MEDGFGARLRHLRKERGLQQGDLAAPGVSVSYISMLENGNRQPTRRVLEHLATVLGIDMAELSGPVRPAEFTTEQRLRLAEAEMALANGDWRTARQQFDALAPEVGLPAAWGVARSLEAAGDMEAAVQALSGILSAAAAAGDGTTLVRAGLARARCLVEAGDDVAALAAAKDAVEASEAHGMTGTDEHVQALSMLVGQYYALNMLADATSAADELLAMVDGGSSWKARGSAYWNAAGVAEARGDMTAAVAHAERALALLGEGDDDRAWARCAIACAWFLMRHETRDERLEDVDRLLAAAEPRLRLTGSETDLAYLQTEQARAALLRGAPDQAAHLADSALAILGSTHRRSESATALLVLAEALTALADPTAADVAGRLELTLLELPSSRSAATTWRGLAEVWRRLQRGDNAYRALEHALNAQAITASPGSSMLEHRVTEAPI